MPRPIISRLASAFSSQSSSEGTPSAEVNSGGQVTVPRDTIPTPHQHLSLEPALEDRINDIIGDREDVTEDPKERLPPLPVPNTAGRRHLSRRIEAWITEVVARDGLVIRYTSHKSNGDIRIQYHHVGGVPGIDADFIRCATTETPTVWSTDALSQQATIADLINRATRYLPLGTNRASFDGTLDWAELTEKSSLADLPDVSGEF